MKNVKRVMGIVTLTFLFSSAIFYSTFSIYRQKKYDKFLTEKYEEHAEKFQEKVEEFEFKYEDLNRSNLDEVQKYNLERIFILSFPNSLSGEKYLKERPYENFLFRYLDIYFREYLYLEILLHPISTFLEINDKIDPSQQGNFYEKLEKYVLKWKEYNEKKENWWNDFEKSEEYKEFLENVFNEIENQDGENLFEIYTKFMQIEKPEGFSLRKRFLYDNLLDIYKIWVEDAYKNFNMHKDEKDFVAAYGDSKMIFKTWKIWNIRKEFSLTDIFGSGTMPITEIEYNIYIDIMIIFYLSILVSSGLTIVLLRKIKILE